MADKLTEKGKRKIKSRMTGGDSTGILFPNVYSGKKLKRKKKPWMQIEVPVGEGPAKRFSTRKKIDIDKKAEGPTKKHLSFTSTMDGKKIKDASWQNGTLQVRKSKGGRIGKQHGGRTNLYEELGRVEAEPSNRNRRAEISRVHRELNRGYSSGGAVLKGKKVGIQIK